MNKKSISDHIDEYLDKYPPIIIGKEVNILKNKGYTLTKAHPKHQFSSSVTVYTTRDVLLSPTWCVGGLTGGGCYGSKADQPIEGEEEPEWLETVLEEIYPQVTLSQFRKLKAKCIKGKYGEGDYYGNHTLTAFKYLPVSDLLEVLSARSHSDRRSSRKR